MTDPDRLDRVAAAIYEAREEQLFPDAEYLHLRRRAVDVGSADPWWPKAVALAEAAIAADDAWRRDTGPAPRAFNAD